MQTTRNFRVGLLGAGYISDFHIQALQRLSNVTIVGIADVDIQRASAIAEKYHLPQGFPSLAAMIEAGVDVIHILTPPSSHADLTVEVLHNGCHAFVEKPLATSTEDCLRIATAARAANKRVGVNHSNLRDPFFVQALDVVRSGAIGEVVSATYLRSSVYPPYRGGPLPPQYRDGGYPFRDMGVHGLYMLQAFLGDIADVSASFTSKGTDPNLMFDEWAATVKCARGLGQLRLSWNVQPLQSQMIIEGTHGVIRADMFSMYVTTRKKTRLPGSAERIVNALGEAGQIASQVTGNVFRYLMGSIRRYHGLQEMIREFYESLATDKPVAVSPADAMPVVEWTERVAREADIAKNRILQSQPQNLTAETLVTGGTGFIGRHLVKRLLDAGQRVRLFVRRVPHDPLFNNPKVEIVLGDLGDPKAVARAVAGTKLVYHLGAAMKGGEHEFERGTVVGTQNIVDSVLAHRVPKLVYVSSLSVLHATAATPASTVREDWPFEPHPEKRGAYTSAKLQAEKIVRQAVAERGLPAIILRPGQVFGPGAPLLTPAVARKVGKRLVIIGNGKLVLPLIYVEDLIDAVLAAGRGNNFYGSVFQIVGSAMVTQNELTEKARRVLFPDASIVHIPKFMMSMLGFGVEILGKLLRRKVPLSRYRINSALAPLHFDCTAAHEGLGWFPVTGVEAGLDKTLKALSQPVSHASPTQSAIKESFAEHPEADEFTENATEKRAEKTIEDALELVKSS